LEGPWLELLEGKLMMLRKRKEEIKPEAQRSEPDDSTLKNIRLKKHVKKNIYLKNTFFTQKFKSLRFFKTLILIVIKLNKN
jgi:hypothetical protein